MRPRPYLRALASAALLLALAGTEAEAAAARFASFGGNVKVTGGVVVNFRAEQSAGCEARFRCDVGPSTIRWSPSRFGLLSATRFPGGAGLHAFLPLFGSDRAGRTIATVRRDATDGSHICTDSHTSEFELIPTRTAGPRAITFGVQPFRDGPIPLTPALGPTACGGPLPGEALAGLPTRTVRLAALRRGPTRIDLSGTSSFASGGVAGTAESTVVLHVNRLRRESLRGEPGRRVKRKRKTKRQRQPERTLDIEYRVTTVSGSISIEVANEEQTCAPLDSCGLAGTTTLTLGPARGQAYLSAYGRVRRGALRRRLGLARGRLPRRVGASGSVFWTDTAGAVTTNLTRNGTPACTDTVPLRDGTIELVVRRRRVVARFTGSPDVFSDPLRTRCPGPLFGQLEGRTLASGRLPLRAWARRRLTLRLDRGARAVVPGYEVSSQPSLTVRLKRTGIHGFTFGGGGDTGDGSSELVLINAPAGYGVRRARSR